MLMVLISVIACLLAAMSVGYWRHSQKPAQRLAACRATLTKLSKTKNCRQDKVASLLRDIYAVINLCMDKGDQAGAYRAVDLLKLVFAEGFWRNDEPLRLTGVVVAALKAKNPDISSVILDAFRPLLIYTSSGFVPAICEQLSLISAIALKQKQHFLVAKASEHIFYILDKREWLEEVTVAEAALNALKVIGIAALKHHDIAFIREISAKIVASKALANEHVANGLTKIFGSWLHQAVKNNDIAAFNEIAHVVELLFSSESLKGSNLIILLNEWKDLAGNAALNPDMTLASAISAQMLSLSAGLGNLRLWARAVSGVVEVTKLALSRGDLEEAFPILLILLESGRKLMLGLKHGRCYDNFSSQAIQIVLKECIMLIEYIARANMTTGSADVILVLFQKWTALPQTQNREKSIRKFCQLVLIYWQNNKKRQAKRTLSDVRMLAEPTLVTEADKEILGI